MSALFHIFRQKAVRESAVEKVCRAMAAPKRLLIVEDDALIVETLAFCAIPYAVDIIAVGSVAAARQELETDGPFEAAILDVRLVNGDGVELYREIVERWPKISVVFMTGYDHPELRSQVEKIGPARVYPKMLVTRADFFEKLLAEVGISKRICENESEKGGPESVDLSGPQ